MDFPGKKSLADDINNFLLIKIVITYIAGIIIAKISGAGIITGLVGSIAATILLIYASKSQRIKTDHSINFVNGLSFASLWIFMGIFLTAYHHVERPDAQSLNSDTIKYGILTTATEEKPKSYKATIQLQNSNHDILAYFQKDSTATIPQCGDLVAFTSQIRYIANQGNPLEFQYAQHMEMQGIYCQTYIQTAEYQILKQGYRKSIRYYGNILREKLISIYRQSGISGKELAVLEALTLGYKADLDNETILSFQTSGAMHILAVSGLHTGIIMLITSIILSFMNYSRKTRILKNAIIIAILWIFAATTGFSSSVCRSALMFSLVAFSQMLQRPASTYNTLAASAFILLLINPMLIFNVGFLLSYLAVLSIISCMPILERIKPPAEYGNISPARKTAQTAWLYLLGIILVSLAAQIGTGVLSIRTFKLFPVYFLITNIAVIPLSYIIMITAILLLFLHWWAPVATVITAILKFFLSMLTSTVSGIESMPASSIKDIYITHWAAILIYAAIALTVLWLHYRKTYYLKWALSAMCAFVLSNIVADSGRKVASQVIIYNKNNGALYSIIGSADPETTVFYSGKNPDKNFMESASNTAALYRKEVQKTICIDSVSNLEDLYFEVKGQSFYIVKAQGQLQKLENENLGIDYVIVSGNTGIKKEQLENVFGRPKCVIFDSSCSQGFVSRMEENIADLDICTHYVCRDGVFGYGDGLNVLEWY